MTPSTEQQFTHILSRINSLEQRFIDLIVPLQNIAGGKALSDLGNLLSSPLLIDDRGLQSTLKDLRATINDFEGKFSSENLDKIFEVIQKAKFHDLYEMLLWQSKHIKDIEMKLIELIEKPPERKVKIDVLLDGKKMCLDPEEKQEENPEDYIDEVRLKVFLKRTEGTKRKSFSQIAKELKVQTNTVMFYWKQVLRKSRKDKAFYGKLKKLVSGVGKAYFIEQVEGD